MSEEITKNIPNNPEQNIEPVDIFGELNESEKRIYAGEFSVALLQEMLSGKNNIGDAEDNIASREEFQTRKEKFLFLLLENYRELLLERPASENLDLIKDTLETLFANKEIAGGANGIDGYIRWSIYRLNACQESKKSVDIVLEIIKVGGVDATGAALIRAVLEKNVAYSENKLLEFLESVHAGNDRAAERIIIAFADLSGAEEVRKKIDERILQHKENESVVNNLKYARALITPDSDKEAILSLKEFYQNNIRFENYRVNELMNKKELSLLQELISKNEKVFEMGCGTGRLISGLAEAGYTVSGCDYTERHVEVTKENLERKGLANKVEVLREDWHRTRFEDKTFGVVYSLGRNILHDYSLLDQAKLFREAARILKPEGKFIFDIPDRKKGEYEKMVVGYAEEMRKRGVDHFRYGAIYDSPDNEHFATRYAYSHDDILELANLSGFEVSQIKKEKLETDKNDENLYYVLKKKTER